MPATRVPVGGLTFHVLDEGQAQGSPDRVALLLHGFPNSSKLWRHQIPALQAAGFRVVAPDLRGFGESDRPTKEAAYDLREHLVKDVLGLLQALGLPRVNVIGHDWGAVLGWALAAAVPQVVRSLVAMSVGHPAAYKDPPLAQREKSWYILFFQFRRAEEALRQHDWRLFRQWTGDYTRTEVDAWIADLERPGALVAALNWYRTNAHPERSLADVDLPTITVPTLGLWSEGDVHLVEEPMKRSGQFVAAGRWRYERVAQASHWLQLDQPAVVNKLLLDFLQAVSP